MTKDTQISIRLPEHLLEELDDLRRDERDVPGRAEMIRRLIDRAALAQRKKPAAKQQQKEIPMT
jgi:metal-responsive CopG/Arc/MetJ family transcriptional regulator